MTVNLMTDGLPLPIDSQLVTILTKHMEEALLKPNAPIKVNAITLNFRDPDYSPESGGYHPVEIRLTHRNGGWHFDYITDFSYVGSGWNVELAKELDFDFGHDLCMTRYLPDVPLAESLELYQLFESNFISYYQMDAFPSVEVSLES